MIVARDKPTSSCRIYELAIVREKLVVEKKPEHCSNENLISIDRSISTFDL